ncbi:MAG: nitronate monooxygenase [Ignavibacteriales bacterium]|nr:nitronate monooxygenase [Ignavibacteriales bacterium]MCF8305713.1 nitronate monooxygenase [Ignavibacteriales bacterium]MCF8315435.1 nitronate monooxygenase [Ignavibacteriales bacterium]MCF8437037.1 nitronate monooxygenase [Ignavibacteriales bacterium]
MFNTRITSLFGIKYPIIQAGMVWVSGWKLASAVSNCGGLGLIGAGSMKPDVLDEHIKKCKNATGKPFGVNIPLLRSDINDLIDVTNANNVKIVFTSAGHPGKHIERFKENDATVVHVVPSLKFALKAEDVGCDAVVGEGYEAGGHNGLDEITTMSLIPRLVDSLKIPVIAAGGIIDGRGVVASMALGAEGVQIGTGFATTIESSAHINYKNRVISAEDNSTVVVLRNYSLSRTLKNNFSLAAIEAEVKGAGKENLKEILGEKRERKGIFEGDESEGMLEAGQGAGMIKEIMTVRKYFNLLIREIDQTRGRICRSFE